MATEVISEIVPKNNGKFPVVSAPNVGVTTATNQTTDATATDGNLMRHSFHLGGPISLSGCSSYRINRLAVRAVAGTTVRFALYDVGDNQLTHLAVLGDAVADGETHVATLSFASGLQVKRDNTIILAFADDVAIHCMALGEGLTVPSLIQYEDAAYQEGAQIAYTTGAAAGDVFAAMFLRDLDFLVEQSLEAYIKGNEERLEQTIYPVEEGVSGQSIAPERHYVFGSVTELTVKLEQINDGKAHEYWFEFEPAEGFTGLTITPTVRWMVDPQFPVGKKCLVGIVRGMAVMGCG